MKLSNGWWIVGCAALVGAAIGFLIPLKTSHATGSRLYTFSAEAENEEPPIGSWTHLRAVVASAESVDATWDVTISALINGQLEAGAGAGSGDWDRPGGLKIGGAGVNISNDLPGTLYTATFTIRNAQGAVTDTHVLNYTKP